LGISGSQQVGYAGDDLFLQHAGLWSGTAASFLDLNPLGASQSGALGISGSQQAGYADIGGATHAGLWSGTAASFVDLHSILGSTYSSSSASGIYTDGDYTYVVGEARSNNDGWGHAILWTIAVPEPQLYALFFALGLFAFAFQRSCAKRAKSAAR
jgi:hypothetical protein